MTGLSRECADDLAEVEALYDLCFAPGREALSSYRFRDGCPPITELCLIWRDEEGILGGAVRHWPVRVAGHDVALLGPLAVHPTRQGEGLGALLMAGALDHARAYGWQRIMLVGDAPYYARFGFARLEGVVMPPPTNPERVLGAALAHGAWDGIRGTVARFDD